VDGVVMGAGSLWPKKSLNWWNIEPENMFLEGGQGAARGRGVHETYLKSRFDLLDLFYFNKPK
jgi:hypothetical protein